MNCEVKNFANMRFLLERLELEVIMMSSVIVNNIFSPTGYADINNCKTKKVEASFSEQDEKALENAIARKKEQEEEWRKAQFESNIRLREFLNGSITGIQSENGNISENVGMAMRSYESAISTFGNSVIENA